VAGVRVIITVIIPVSARIPQFYKLRHRGYLVPVENEKQIIAGRG